MNSYCFDDLNCHLFQIPSQVLLYQLPFLSIAFNALGQA